jgi:hypothetical protein
MGNKPYVLWLIWQNEETRQRYHVGTLIHQNDMFFFKYETDKRHRGLKEAMDNGYLRHLAFPDLNKVYSSSELFGPFARRVPNERRPDFPDLLNSYGLSKDYTQMDLLRATGGRLGTDSYELVAPIYLYDNQFDFDFYIAGWRHWNDEEAIHQITKSMRLVLEREPSNPEDPHAVAVKTTSWNKLGYIPSFYSEFMDQALQSHCQYELSILSVNREARPQLYVQVYVRGTFKELMAKENDSLQPLQKI